MLLTLFVTVLTVVFVITTCPPAITCRTRSLIAGRLCPGSRGVGQGRVSAATEYALGFNRLEQYLIVVGCVPGAAGVCGAPSRQFRLASFELRAPPRWRNG